METPEQPVPSEIGILPYDSSYYWVFKDVKNAELSTKELNEIEVLLKRCIDDYNAKAEEQYKNTKIKYPNSSLEKSQLILELNRYKRQYMAVINSDGEKVVWINCFCNTWNKDWKKEVIMVMDGGNCYFNLKINLTKQTHYEMRVNGEA